MRRGAEPPARRCSPAVVAALGLLSLCVALAPTTATAASPLRTGFADGLFGSPDASERNLWLDRAVDANAGLVRLNVSWRGTAPSRPTAPRNPADPAYDFDSLDAAVRSARSRGLSVMLTVLRAPNWAEGSNRPGRAPEGTWKPKPAAFGDFGAVLARRYSGSFTDPSAPLSPLPRVDYLQAWNEQNLAEYLTPQYKGRRQVSAGHYRNMLNAFYAGVKDGRRGAKVVAGGTGPFGDPPGGDRTRPLKFWRDLLCLKDRRKLKPARCKGAQPARFDIAAHHPISTSGGPRRSAIHPDDMTIPDMRALQRTLRAAEKRNTVRGPRRHQLWATEMWWESNPPDRRQGVPVRRHALWIDQALHSLWRQGVDAAINLQIRDSQFDPGDPFQRNTTGIYFFDGNPKPARQAFRFPLFADRVSRTKVKVWSKAPGGGRVQIQVRKSGNWRNLTSARAPGHGVFTKRVRLRGKASVRAVRGGSTSYAYAVGKNR